MASTYLTAAGRLPHNPVFRQLGYQIVELAQTTHVLAIIFRSLPGSCNLRGVLYPAVPTPVYMGMDGLRNCGILCCGWSHI